MAIFSVGSHPIEGSYWLLLFLLIAFIISELVDK